MYECAGLQVPLPSRLLASAVSCIYGFRNQELLTSTGPYTDGFLHCSVTLRKSDGSFIFVMLECNRLITCRFLCISSRLVRRLIQDSFSDYKRFQQTIFQFTATSNPVNYIFEFWSCVTQGWGSTVPKPMLDEQETLRSILKSKLRSSVRQAQVS